MTVKNMYKCKDIMLLLDVAENCAYEIIREMRDEISKTQIPGTNRNYAMPPRGRVPAKFFCEKYMLDREVCDEILLTKAG